MKKFFVSVSFLVLIFFSVCHQDDNEESPYQDQGITISPTQIGSNTFWKCYR